MTTVHAFAAAEPGAPVEPFTYTLGPIGPGQVDIRVEACGICHSDVSMIDNQWGMSAYPLVAGHEVVGTVEAVGSGVSHLRVGQAVGLGWYSGSCLTCRTCMSGQHNLCGSNEQTIVGRHGGFADRVRCRAEWAIPLPQGVDRLSAGPLFCGGITVFGPIAHFGVRPTDRVGVIGIGGLGHLAIKFLRAWGCEVTAFTSSADKAAEAQRLGAHRAVNSRDDAALALEAARFNFILSTVNVPLNWDLYIAALAPNGRLHNVGAVLEPIPVGAFSLIMGQKSISGSPLGSPATTSDMLDFCARHQIAPQIEVFEMSRLNDALDHLRSGKARYRVVVKN